MTTQTIEIEGLPEGWKAVAYRVPEAGEWFLGDYSKEVHKAVVCVQKAFILEKIQPRRIVLEESSDYNKQYHSGLHETQVFSNGLRLHNQTHVWREVKETDIPLTNDEPKLSFCVADCKSLLSTNDNYAAYNKIKEFIKENS